MAHSGHHSHLRQMKPIIMFFGFLHLNISPLVQRFNWRIILEVASSIVEFYGHIKNYLINVGL